MKTSTEQRKLAAIMLTDMAGRFLVMDTTEIGKHRAHRIAFLLAPQPGGGYFQ